MRVDATTVSIASAHGATRVSVWNAIVERYLMHLAQFHEVLLRVGILRIEFE
jgi:hypothetical protein